MPSITHLKNIYDSKGVSYITDLFQNNVVITEKIDGARFAFERNGNKLVYYKRDETTPITLIDRTIMVYYEKCISYIESLPMKDIPQKTLFGFEYFTNTNPGSTEYDIIPINGLILTDITRDGHKITDQSELISYSNQFNVSPPPVLFNGKLSNSQITELMKFMKSTWDDLYNMFDKKSFTEFIITIVDSNIKSTTLNTDIIKPIEGLVLDFELNNGKHIVTKVVDPLYTRISRERARNRMTSTVIDNNGILKQWMKSLIEYTSTNGDTFIKFMKYRSKNPEMRYIEILSNIFYEFRKHWPEHSNIIPMKIPIPELDLNYNNITNTGLRVELKSNPDMKTLFKTYLSSYGKIRKRGNRVLDGEMVSNINDFIDKSMKILQPEPTVESIMDKNLSKLIKPPK